MDILILEVGRRLLSGKVIVELLLHPVNVRKGGEHLVYRWSLHGFLRLGIDEFLLFLESQCPAVILGEEDIIQFSTCLLISLDGLLPEEGDPVLQSLRVLFQLHISLVRHICR